MTTLIDALHRANTAAAAIRETYDGFDNHYLQEPWKGMSHHDMMTLFDSLGEFIETLTAQLLHDLGDTPTNSTGEIFGPRLHAHTAQALDHFTILYKNITETEMTVTNPELIEKIWGNPNDPDAPHDWHRTLHNTLCETINIYPRLIDTLERNKHLKTIQARKKEDYIEAAREATLRAEKAEKENRLLRNSYGVGNHDNQKGDA